MNYEIARNLIVLTATRPDGFNGDTIRCGLAYDDLVRQTAPVGV